MNIQLQEVIVNEFKVVLLLLVILAFSISNG